MALPIVLKNENEIVRASVKDLNLLPKIEVAQRSVCLPSPLRSELESR